MARLLVIKKCPECNSVIEVVEDTHSMFIKKDRTIYLQEFHRNCLDERMLQVMEANIGRLIRKHT